jgi:steroid 5-alpha reductase family enzyme
MMHVSLSKLPGWILPIYDVHFQNLIDTWLIMMIVVSMACFIVSEITRNYSQVDKLWSLIPVAYSWITVAAYPSPRLFLMALLVTIWGLRLSYNFYRKGGYNIIPWKGKEDYRWKVIRETSILKGRFRFGLFNLVFISVFQNIVIFLFSSPLLMAAVYNENSLSIIDILAAALMLTFILTESIADNQQFRFHKEKKDPSNIKKIYSQSLEKGFLSEGLWRYVRHPNFTSEQAIWLSFYFFGVAASGKWINITLSGAVLLILIFLGSAKLTENISSSKYPDYVKYISEVPKFIPRIFNRRN